MTTNTRSAIRLLVITAMSLIVAVATGVGWLGHPFRLVELVTLIGLSMTAGSSWTLAVWQLRHGTPRAIEAPPTR